MLPCMDGLEQSIGSLCFALVVDKVKTELTFMIPNPFIRGAGHVAMFAFNLKSTSVEKIEML